MIQFALSRRIETRAHRTLHVGSLRPLWLAFCMMGLWLCALRVPAAPLYVHVGEDWRKMTPRQCRLKAVEAMGYKQNFISAQAEGNGAWGQSENAFVLVHYAPERDGLRIAVIAVSRDNAEAERLRNAVRAFVFDGILTARPGGAQTRVRTSDQSRWNKGLNLYLETRGSEHHALPAPAFTDAARAGMADKQLKTSQAGGGQVVVGANENSLVVAVYYPHINLAPPDPRASYFVVAAFSEDRTQARQLTQDVYRKISGVRSL